MKKPLLKRRPILKFENIDPSLFVKYGGSQLSDKLREMAAGDVIAISGTHQSRISTQARFVASRSDPAREYATHKLPDGRIAVKRIA